MDIIAYTAGAAVITPIVLGLVQALKQIVSTKYAPVLALGLGLILGLTWANLQGVSWIAGIFTGIISGLSACGLWSASKTYLKPEFPKVGSSDEHTENPVN